MSVLADHERGHRHSAALGDARKTKVKGALIAPTDRGDDPDPLTAQTV